MRLPARARAAKRGSAGRRDAGSVGHGRGACGADAGAGGQARRTAVRCAVAGDRGPRRLCRRGRVAASDAESARRRRRLAAYGRQGGRFAGLGRCFCARQCEGELERSRRAAMASRARPAGGMALGGQGPAHAVAAEAQAASGDAAKPPSAARRGCGSRPTRLPRR